MNIYLPRTSLQHLQKIARHEVVHRKQSPTPASSLLLNARRERAEVVPVLLLDGHDLALQPENGASPGGPSAGPRRGRVIANFFRNILAKFRSFSAVSASIFASKYAFYSILQNLPDYLAAIFEI